MSANDKSTAEISKQAAVWWVVLTDEQALSCKQRRQFCRWLLSSRRHILEFILVCFCEERLTRTMRLRKAAEPDQSNVTYVNWWRGSLHKPRETRPPHHTPRWGVAAALVILPLSFFVTSDSNVEGPVGTIASTINRESRTEQLEDGSEVSRDARARLRVEFTAKRRDVRLDDGQARFKVAEDAARPFQVLTFLVDATAAAASTDFTVEVEPGLFVDVHVHEGVVELSRRGATAEAAVIRLEKGQHKRLHADEFRALMAAGNGGSRAELVDG